MRFNFIGRFILALTAMLLSFAPQVGAAADAKAKQKVFRVLHVMSYHSPWRWTDGQLEGFQEGWGAAPMEVRTFQMDTKTNSSSEAKTKKGKEALALVEQWKPDLVYTTDDDAQAFFAKHLAGSKIPVVFSAVNMDPSLYGFRDVKNVSGVLEQPHFAESVRLLRQISPNVKRLAVVFDGDPLWHPVEAIMRQSLAKIPEVSVVSWDTITRFDEFQQKMAEYPSKVDAVALIGIFNFKDADGKNVPYQQVLQWTAENSKLPDLGFWVDRVHFGTLVAVTVSEREQGLAAGRIAKQILIDGKSPSSIPMLPTTKGQPVISLARARTLGLKLNSAVLLSSEVIQTYDWNKTK